VRENILANKFTHRILLCTILGYSFKANITLELNNMHLKKVWDIPVRVCHWGLVIIIVFQYLSAEVFDENILPNTMQWHFYAGYACITLVVFRLCWGVFGSYYAKFSQFVVSPLTSIQYLKNKQAFNQYLGHNPAGAYSIIVLLTLILTQAVSGMFISDEIFNDGIYYGVLGDRAQDIANFLHHNIFKVLFAFIALHIVMIIFYKIHHKENLTKAMITGNKEVTHNQARQYQNEEKEVFPWIGLGISIGITAFVMYLILAVLPAPPTQGYYGY
jgi:cytochrome b